MSAVIQHTSSINNSFISTTDHLPCDVIRSVWLVQTCNISIHKARFRLNHLLIGLQSGQPSKPELKYNVTKEIIELKQHIDRLRMEAVSESKALKNQLITHKYFLGQELDQLKNITDHRKNNQLNSDSPDNDELRKQLEKYYRENPLKSQREATKEQEEYARIQKECKRSAKLVVPKKKKKTGLKLVFKVPGSKKKVEKPKAARIKQKQPKVKAPKIEEIPVEPEEDNNLYCFCRQKSFGDMIACDNERSCPNGEWFHYKCVGLLNRVEALKYTTGAKKWFCSEHCRAVVENEKKKKRKRRW